MFLADTLILDAPKRTKEGFLAVRAKACRSGVYDYRGVEIDPEGKHFAADQVVKVYRPADEVFDKDAVHSFLLKPITDDHPKVPVTADNWREHAKGVNAGAIRDGEYLAFDLVLMDAEAIKQVDAGKRELSNGYQSEIEIGDGVAPDGTAYQATQRRIRGNHVAIVDKGRAGPECRIGDTATCSPIPVELLDRLLDDGQTYRGTDDNGNLQPARRETSNSGGSPVATKTITFDGLPLEVTDAAEAAITKLQTQLKDAVDAKAEVDKQVTALTTDKVTLETKVADLEKKLEDSKVTPAQLRDAAKEYQAVVDKAKALGVEVTDDMDETAIMKAAVTARVGDASKDWGDEHIAISFATLSAPTNDDEPDALRRGIRDSVRIKDGAAELKTARAKWLADKEAAYRGQAA